MTAQDGKWTEAKSFHNFIFINLAGDFSNDGSLEEACIACEPPDQRSSFLCDGWWCYISAKIPFVIPLWSISKRATLKFPPFGESMIWCQNDAFKLWSRQVINMSHRWQCVGSKFNGIDHDFADLLSDLRLCRLVKSSMKSRILRLNFMGSHWAPVSHGIGDLHIMPCCKYDEISRYQIWFFMMNLL